MANTKNSKLRFWYPVTSSPAALNAALAVVAARSAEQHSTRTEHVAAEISVEGPSFGAMRRARHLLRQLRAQGRVRSHVSAGTHTVLWTC
jgi:hypothetical protein